MVLALLSCRSASAPSRAEPGSAAPSSHEAEPSVGPEASTTSPSDAALARSETPSEDAAAPAPEPRAPLPAEPSLVMPLRAVAADGFVAMTNGDARLYASARRGAAVERERPVFLASFTKLWVAVAALRMVERRTLSLSATIRDLVPELSSRPWATATLEELLTHTSEVPELDDAQTGYFRARVDLSNPAKVLAAHVPTAFKEKRGVYKYRNAEIAIAGVMLSARETKPLAKVLADEVFGPAGMTHAGLFTGAAPEGLDVSVMGGVRPQNFLGAGAGYASPADLLSFFDALDGGKLLSAESRARLFDGQRARADGAMGCWAYPFDKPGGGRTLLVERTGTLGNVRLFSAYFPDEHRAVVAWNGVGGKLGRPRGAGGPALAIARAALATSADVVSP